MKDTAFDENMRVIGGNHHPEQIVRRFHFNSDDRHRRFQEIYCDAAYANIRLLYVQIVRKARYYDFGDFKKLTRIRFGFRQIIWILQVILR